MCDISVYAQGTYNGKTVTYGSLTAPDHEVPLGALFTQYPDAYYWGPCDNFPSTNSASPPAYAFYYNVTATNIVGYGLQDTGFGAGDNPLIEMDSTNSPQTLSFVGPYWAVSPIYIGPFSYGTTITDLQFRARWVQIRANNCWVPVEIAPLGYNFPSGSLGLPWYNPSGVGQNSPYVPTKVQEAETFANVMGSAGGNVGPTGQPYSPTFVFEVKNFAVANNNFQDVTYEATDPRVYRYTNDWTMRSDTRGITPTPQSYTGSYTDTAITGVTGDSSKFAWPNLGLSYYDSSYEGQYMAQFNKPQSGTDIRHIQYANNIQGLPGIGWLSCLPLNCESSQGSPSSTGGSGAGSTTSGTPIPWRTLSLEANKNAGTLIPDWLLLEAFGIAYDQTFCSHTEGKLNVNTTITAAFPAGTTIAPRTKPLAALIAPTSYPASGSSNLAPMSAGTLTSITNAIAGGPGSTYANLPSDIFMYPGQLCELGLQTASAGATNQLQRESLMRDLIGTLTTQSSDFLVHVVAQSIKQVNFNATVNPVTDLQVTSEQRMSALVSRLPNLGPDNIPDSGWTNASQNLSSTLADENVTAGVTNTITALTVPVSSGVTNTWVTSAPTFRYTVSDIQYANSQ